MAAKLFKIAPDSTTAEAQYLDIDTHKVYSDADGGVFLREMIPSEDGFLLTGNPNGSGRPVVVRDEMGEPAHISHLANEATTYEIQKRANLSGATIKAKYRDRFGKVVNMDLAPTDVHQPATLPTYAGGYRIARGIADIVSPVILTPKQADYYATWNSTANFSRKMVNVNAAGGQIAEVSPSLSFTQFNAVTYAIGGALSTEVVANADSPIVPMTKMMQTHMDALELEREARVVALIQASASWNSSLIQALAASAQWNEGASSNPILVLHKAIDASYMTPTGIALSGQAWRAFARNPNVQKFFTFKDMVDGIPTPEALSDKLKLPPFYVAEMKYTVGGALSFAWGNNAVLFHQPGGGMPPTSQMDVATNATFRWLGGGKPSDGELSGGGFVVRSYYDPKRGPRGSTVMVTYHSDSEQQTSTLVGGLITGVIQ